MLERVLKWAVRGVHALPRPYGEGTVLEARSGRLRAGHLLP